MTARTAFDAYRPFVPEGARLIAVTEEVLYRTRARYGAAVYVTRESRTVTALALVGGAVVAEATCPAAFGADRDALSALRVAMIARESVASFALAA